MISAKGIWKIVFPNDKDVFRKDTHFYHLWNGLIVKEVKFEKQSYELNVIHVDVCSGIVHRTDLNNTVHSGILADSWITSLENKDYLATQLHLGDKIKKVNTINFHQHR
jgi:hypothetical protein